MSEKHKDQNEKDIPYINESEMMPESIEIDIDITEKALKSLDSVSIVTPYFPEHKNAGIIDSNLEEDNCIPGSSREQNDQNEFIELLSPKISIDSCSQINPPKMRTLEIVIQEFQEDETFIELKNECVNEEIDLSNLNKLLKRKDSCGFFYSILLILDIKAQPFGSKFLKTYLLCLDNIYKSLPTNIIKNEISRLLNRLKDCIFDFEKSIDEKFNCITKLKRFCYKNKELIDGWKAKAEFLDNLYTLNKSMKICFSKKNFKSRPEKVEKVISSEIENLENSSLFKNIELRDRYFECLKSYCEKIQCLSPSLITLIDSKKTPIDLSISYKFAQNIEEELLGEITRYLSHEVDLGKIKTICQLIKDKYLEQINNCYFAYLSTCVNSFPDIDKALCWALSNLLDLPIEIFLIRIYKNEAEFSREKYMLTSFVNEFSKFNIEIQYIIIEMLSRIDERDYSHLDFLITKTNINTFSYARIDKTWAIDFVEIASNAPFAEALERFNKTNTGLKKQLKKFTKNIILMEMPSQLYGFTLFNLNVVLKRFIDPVSSKGATFVVYLHELAHILQRLSSSTIDESSHVRTQENFNVSEAGFLIEAMIFGNRLFHITDKAAEFLVSKNLPENLDEFQHIFKKTNEKKFDENFTALNRASSITPLGGCLSLSRNVK